MTKLFWIVPLFLIAKYTQAQRIDIIENKYKTAEVYAQNNIILEMKDIARLVKPNRALHKRFRRERVLRTISGTLTSSGFLFTMIGTGAALSENTSDNREFGRTVMGIGSIAILAAIPFNIGTRKRVRRIVDEYNQGADDTASSFCPTVQGVLTTNGVGIAVRF